MVQVPRVRIGAALLVALEVLDAALLAMGACPGGLLLVDIAECPV
jgi:hypothetical protein